MNLSPGDKLGPFEILSQLGAGGMGKVWKARDTRLNRTVAIKTSNQRFSERFSREAQAIAALNHPNICTLYDVGPDYLVMELVEGKRIAGPLPIEEALTLAGQILDALDAAHRKGITHRDLKPGNILLGKNGVKVLDFGLAKFERTVAGQDDATVTMPLTADGAILGTLQYMSPEQLEGKEADARSDIFSFGLVLYELIAGKRAFTGGSQASLMASILKEQPPSIQTLQPLTPTSLERVLLTCLEKDPDKRWQSAREVKHALEWMAQAAPLAPPARVEPPAKKLRLWQTAAAFMGLIAVAAAGWAYWSRPAVSTAMTRFQVPLPENVSFDQYMAISPDGRKIVLNAIGERGGLWVRDLDALEWRQLPDTEGSSTPAWSPDSKFISFSDKLKLKKIAIEGGPPQTLCEMPNGFPVGMAAWNRDGLLVFGGRGRGPLWKVSQAGGVPVKVTELAQDDGFHALPAFMPDGKHFLYYRGSTDPEKVGMYAGSLDAPPADQGKERILAVRFAAPFVDGYLFFMRESTLMGQLFDSDAMKLSGEPVPVAEHVGTRQANGLFSVSPSGALAYRAADEEGKFQLTWVDRQGKTIGNLGEAGLNQGISLSPDGTKLAMRDAATSLQGDLWTLDLTRGVRTRLTFSRSFGSNPIWSPDGSSVAFSVRQGYSIFEKPSSGAGDEKELLMEPNRSHNPSDYSPDGRFLLYRDASVTDGVTGTGNDLWVLPLDGARKPAQLLATKADESGAQFSPDMRWIAYHSNASGRNEVYVRPFVAAGPAGVPALGEGQWQVSKDGGQGSKWRDDGKELFFQGPANAKMAVDVRATGAVFEPGIPQRLFAAASDGGWDVTGDGKRFLLAMTPTQQNAQTPLTVVLNWQAQLKK